MGIFWDLQRLGSRKGNFSTIGCTNHISSWRDTNIAHRWWTCDLFYANKHKIPKKCVESHKIIFTPESPLLHYLGRYSFFLIIFLFCSNFSYGWPIYLRISWRYILTSSIWIVRNWSRVPLRILQRLVTCLRSHGCYVVYGNKELLKGGIARMAKSSLVVVCIFCCWEVWSRVVRKFLTLFIGPCPSGCIINIVNIWCMDKFFLFFYGCSFFDLNS